MQPLRPTRGRPVDPELRARRIRQILDAAYAVFVRKGFHAASMADISAQAGLAVASVYLYFPSKDDLVLAMVEDDLQENLQRVGELARAPDFVAGVLDQLRRLDGDARDAGLPALQLEIFAEALRNPRVAAALRASETRLLRDLTATLAEARARGAIDRAADPEGLATVLLLVFEGLYAHRALGLSEPGPTERELVRLLTGRPPAGPTAA